MTVRILKGDCREVLRELPAESVHCVVTSPPYWRLRDYGVAGQIGLEESYADYINGMVEVFREVRRVLRSDGTCWMNLGDSYYAGDKGPNDAPDRVSEGTKQATNLGSRWLRSSNRTPQLGLKPKDLVGIPWRVAFALQADGWYLRQDIIWAKPNPMPESVRDRCTKSHEYLFLLSKSERYSYDADAIREEWTCDRDDMREKGVRTGLAYLQQGPLASNSTKTAARAKDGNGAARPPTSRPHSLSQFEADHSRTYDGRNKRSVWTVTTQPFPEAHFATFPPALIEPCILAGCPAGGTVLDPFGGAGTTGLVADRLGRNAVLIELNPEYAAMAERRIKADAGMFASVE